MNTRWSPAKAPDPPIHPSSIVSPVLVGFPRFPVRHTFFVTGCAASCPCFSSISSCLRLVSSHFISFLSNQPNPIPSDRPMTVQLQYGGCFPEVTSIPSSNSGTRFFLFLSFLLFPIFLPFLLFLPCADRLIGSLRQRRCYSVSCPFPFQGIWASLTFHQPR